MLLCCFCIFCSQPFLPFGCFLVSICTFLHWRSQCDSAWSMPLIGLSWLPSRLPCNSLQFHQGSCTYLLSMGLLCRYNCCNYYYCNSNLSNDWKLTWKKKTLRGEGGTSREFEPMASLLAWQCSNNWAIIKTHKLGAGPSFQQKIIILLNSNK